MARPLLLIHGYSSDGAAMIPLQTALTEALQRLHVPVIDINIGNYVSLNNEITIKDLGEGLQRAIQETPKLQGEAEFDAVVHSTGILVVRAWLSNHPSTVGSNARLQRLKHLIGVAPATWGSPQASQGRTFIGALVKGNRQFGPDFMNAGDQILDGLELGSKFTWDLAHLDMLGKQPYFGPGADTPYVAVFIGNQGYTGIDSVANEPGTDGTVRWAGCGMNTRKITLDLTEFPIDAEGNRTDTRVSITPWASDARLNVPMIAVDGKNHGTLISDPEPGMVELIAKFLSTVESPASYDAWVTEAVSYSQKGLAKMQWGPGEATSAVGKAMEYVGHLLRFAGKPLDGWQQFVIHARDEHGDPVKDFLIQVFRPDGTPVPELYADVHAYTTDESYRCFHVQLDKGMCAAGAPLEVHIRASAGTALVGYRGYGTDNVAKAMSADADPVVLTIPGELPGGGSLFHPFTTTLVEIVLDRKPYPFVGISSIFDWQKVAEAANQAGAGGSIGMPRSESG
jgi:pimeloyl-ACP methyl ester carboxylesterase